MADENSQFAAKLIRETCFIKYLQFFAQQWDRLESDTKDYVLSIVQHMTGKMRKYEIKLNPAEDFDALVHLVKLHLGTAITQKERINSVKMIQDLTTFFVDKLPLNEEVLSKLCTFIE